MIPKSLYSQYRKEHPLICGTCWYYEQLETDGLCYGVPPTDGKTGKVKPSRRACSLHPDNVEDLHRLITQHDLVSTVVTVAILARELK